MTASTVTVFKELILQDIKNIVFHAVSRARQQLDHQQQCYSVECFKSHFSAENLKCTFGLLFLKSYLENEGDLN